MLFTQGIKIGTKRKDRRFTCYTYTYTPFISPSVQISISTLPPPLKSDFAEGMGYPNWQILLPDDVYLGCLFGCDARRN